MSPVSDENIPLLTGARKIFHMCFDVNSKHNTDSRAEAKSHKNRTELTRGKGKGKNKRSSHLCLQASPIARAELSWSAPPRRPGCLPEWSWAAPGGHLSVLPLARCGWTALSEGRPPGQNGQWALGGTQDRSHCTRKCLAPGASSVTSCSPPTAFQSLPIMPFILMCGPGLTLGTSSHQANCDNWGGRTGIKHQYSMSLTTLLCHLFPFHLRYVEKLLSHLISDKEETLQKPFRACLPYSNSISIATVLSQAYTWNSLWLVPNPLKHTDSPSGTVTIKIHPLSGNVHRLVTSTVNKYNQGRL